MTDSVDEKVKIKLPQIEKVKVKFTGAEDQTYNFLLSPYLTIFQKSQIMQTYLECLFGDGEEGLSTRYIAAEHVLMSDVIEQLTNIDVESLDFKLVQSSGLWGEIVSRIPDYQAFRNELAEVLKIYQYQEKLNKSVGSVVDSLAVRIVEFMDKIQDLDVDKLQNISQEFTSKLDELNKVVPGIVSSNNEIVAIPEKPKRGRRKTVKDTKAKPN